MTLCPKEQIVLSDDVCSHCEYKRRPDDVSNLWCRYRIGKSRSSKNRNDSYGYYNSRHKKQLRKSETGSGVG